MFSLAVVVGLLLLLARLSAKRLASGAGAPIRVLHRQSLSRNGSVALVAVGDRVLVLGTTDQQVSLLTELDPDEVDIPEPTSIFRPKDTGTAAEDDGAASADRPAAAAGSILSPQTWRQAFDAATRRVS
ncbi:flagellar biosynthetic protein FliO [uncultured Nocardioides sp.]|uniref:flagellar biosynthetic protein FliO n=1 Tax=uncultured Nocardioides sp. TaxID=198441 RepID=UPI0025CF55F1|nr:flagellar biosynthetic protein FliO [uncultured Nocardioides sp.]